MGHSGLVSGSGAGMEVSASLVQSLRQPPPPPPASTCSRSSAEKDPVSKDKGKGYDDRVSDGGLKRRLQSAALSPSRKRARRSPSSTSQSSESSSGSSSFVPVRTNKNILKPTFASNSTDQ